MPINKKKSSYLGRNCPIFRICLRGNTDYFKYVVKDEESNFHIKSFYKFLQHDKDPLNRDNCGLEKLFRKSFPLYYAKKEITVKYISYDIEQPKVSPDECISMGITYNAKLYVKLCIERKGGESTNASFVVGDLPMITNDGSFIINGHERIFIHQFKKSPGCLFLKEQDSYGRSICSAKLLPKNGSWLHFRLSSSGILVAIDTRKEIALTTFLLCFPKSFSYENDNKLLFEYEDLSNILNRFYETITITFHDNKCRIPFNKNDYIGCKLPHDIYIDEKCIAKSNLVFTGELFNAIPDDCSYLDLPLFALEGLFLAEDIIDSDDGSIIFELGTKIDSHVLKVLQNRSNLQVYKIDKSHPPYILNGLNHDGIFSSKAALSHLMDILKLKNYDSDEWMGLFISRFMNTQYYSLEEERVRINKKLDINETSPYLTMNDMVGIYKKLVQLEAGEIDQDSIDDLANKVIHGVCEILTDAFADGLSRLEKYLRDRIGVFSLNGSSRFDALNFGVMLFLVNESFYKVAQIVNDTNYLARISQSHQVTHIIPGKNSQKNISDDLRELRASKLFRCCSVQSPEGAKVGIHEHQSAYLEISKGLLLVKYHPVVNGIASDEVISLDVCQEKGKHIASLDSYRREVNESGKVIYVPKDKFICAKCDDLFTVVLADKIDYVSVSPGQSLSRASSCLPFIGTSDPYRMLVASSMSKQAVYVCRPATPIVSTGMNGVLAHKIIAKNSGKVIFVDAESIVIQNDTDQFFDFYSLTSIKKTSSDCAVLQSPLVAVGDIVDKGDMIADGFSTKNGELSLSQNILVALMVSKNTYEDASAVSDALIKSGKLTSLSVKKLVVEVLETAQGSEQLSKDLPGVPHSATGHLDESGIACVGSYLKPGDIAVGKVIPNNSVDDESYSSRLLKSVVSGYASNFYNVSSIVPNGISGYVADVKIAFRKGVGKDSRTLLQEMKETQKLNSKLNIYFIASLQKILIENIINVVGDVSLDSDFIENNVVKIKKNTLIKDIQFDGWGVYKICNLPVNNAAKAKIQQLVDLFVINAKKYESEKKTKIKNLNVGSELEDGVLKTITITIINRNPIEVGDKVTNNFANKSVVGEIVKECDMPYLEDGTPIELEINALSLLGRMNLGQVFEMALTTAIENKRKQMRSKLFRFINNKSDDALQASLLDDLKFLIKDRINEFGYESFDDLDYKDIIDLTTYFVEKGINVLIPPFEDFSDKDLRECMSDFGYNGDGRYTLYSGKTGEKFKDKSLIGYISVSKLYHFVISKLSARSIGPYNMMGFPTAGLKQEGGQRLGEMEVWALEAHGVAGLLQEFRTAKANDEISRRRLGNSQIKGDAFSILIANTDKRTSIIGNASGLLLASHIRSFGFEVEEVDADDAFGKSRKALKIFLTDKAYGLPIENEDTYQRKAFKPVPGGLFCSKIFGPTENFTCACRKYVKVPGIICEDCGVETIHSSSRAKRMSHIEFPSKVYIVHPWFMRIVGNKICFLLNISFKMLKDICNLDLALVVKKGDSPYEEGSFVSVDEYHDYLCGNGRPQDQVMGFSLNNFGLESAMGSVYGFDSSKVLIGGAAIRHLLSKINLEECIKNEKEKLLNSTSLSQTKKHIKNLNTYKRLYDNGVDLTAMVRSNVPVMPPAYRPMALLDNWQYMTSDLNNLYKHVKSAVDCFNQIINSGIDVLFLAKEAILRLTNAVNNLFGGATETKTYNQEKEYRSIEDRLKGKDGLLRKYGLANRIDFSARSVIAVDVDLALDECIIPEEIMLKLLELNILSELCNSGVASSFHAARSLFRKRDPIIFEVLYELVRTKYSTVCLNRAPTLHKYGFMGFKVHRLYKGRAILINPQVCTHFNADFDGDTMFVSIPHAVESVAEVKMLMMPSKMLGSSTNGALMLKFLKHMSFGLYAMTESRGEFSGRIFRDYKSIFYAVYREEIEINQEFDYVLSDDNVVRTTFGRVSLWKLLPINSGIKFSDINRPISGSFLQKLIQTMRRNIKNDDEIVEFANKAKDFAFSGANTFVGSIGVNDLINVPGREDKIREGIEQQMKLERLFNMKLFNEAEMRSSSVNLWQGIISKLQNDMMEYITKERPLLNVFLNSGAGGSKSSFSQMFLLKGNIVGLDGKVLLTPVALSHKDSIRSLWYFIVCSGTRKSMTDVGSNTSVSGYFERKVINVEKDMIIRGHDCGTDMYYTAKNMFDKDGVFLCSWQDVVENRVLGKDIIDPDTKKVILKKNTLINNEVMEILESNDITEVIIRSPVFCRMPVGLCSLCYGAVPGTFNLVNIGEAVGILAAHAVGEPGTQLTMRAFHTGGIARFGMSKSELVTPFAGKIEFINVNTIIDKKGDNVNISRIAKIRVVNARGMLLSYFDLPYGSIVHFADGSQVEARAVIATKGNNRVILAEKECTVKFVNLDNRFNCEQMLDEAGIQRIVITSDKGSPMVSLSSGESYNLPVGTILVCNDGDKMVVGSCIGYVKKDKSSLDVVAGLQIIIATLENGYGDLGYLSPCDGTILECKKNLIRISDLSGDVIDVKITGANAVVHVGQKVLKGDLITSGQPQLQEILNILGTEKLVDFLKQKLLSVYLEQSLSVSIIHLETIIAALISKCEIVASSHSSYVVGEILHFCDLYQIRKNVGKTIKARRIITGLTNTALNGLSILSSCAFQEIVRVFIERLSSVDHLYGMNESVMLSRPIPAGTGLIYDLIKQNAASLIQQASAIKVS